jgi:hypothetical protein
MLWFDQHDQSDGEIVMKLDHCEYDLETKFVEPCEDCRRTRFTRKIPIRVGDLILYVTFLYEIRNCLEGFTSGDLLYAMSLLPKEEQEVEIVQKSRYERALHEQRSVESEFENEFMNTLRTQASLTNDVNTSVSGSAGVDLGIFEVGGGASVSTATHFSTSVFAETVNKTSISVSNHYEVSVDTKTQIENQYRSLRKISNPNACRVVTYFFKQLNKKYKVEIVLLGIRFDLIRQLPPIHAQVLPYHIVKPNFAISTLQPATLVNVNPQEATKLNVAQQTFAFRAATQDITPQLHADVQDAFRTLVFRDVEPAKELEADAFIAKLETMDIDKAQKEKAIAAMNELNKRKDNQPGFVLFSGEYCLRTNSVVAEPKVSNCSICACEACDSGGKPIGDGMAGEA